MTSTVSVANPAKASASTGIAKTIPAAQAVRGDGDGEFCIVNKEDGLPPGAPPGHGGRPSDHVADGQPVYVF
ncbi:MAG: hypothetical protein NTY17_09240 [Planctomycetia bacterium]|nr:hypothetical protein [Planctomycetia bacterium]